MARHKLTMAAQSAYSGSGTLSAPIATMLLRPTAAFIGSGVLVNNATLWMVDVQLHLLALASFSITPTLRMVATTTTFPGSRHTIDHATRTDGGQCDICWCWYICRQCHKDNQSNCRVICWRRHDDNDGASDIGADSVPIRASGTLAASAIEILRPTAAIFWCRYVNCRSYQTRRPSHIVRHSLASAP